MLILALPSVALPCSGPLCEDRFRSIPGAGQTIPANAPAAGVRAATFSERNWDGGTQVLLTELGQTALRQADGGAVATGGAVDREGARLFVPTAGFVAGAQYVTAWDAGSCSGIDTFAVGPSAPIPTAAATLSIDTFATLPGSGQPGSCFEPVGPTQDAYLKIVPDPQMVPWLAVTRWELELDGKNWATADYGRVIAGGSVGGRNPGSMRRINTITVRCGSSTTGLEAGKHEVRLLGRIAGLDASIASNTVSVTFDCGASGGGGGGKGCSSTGEAAPLVALMLGLLVLARRNRRA